MNFPETASMSYPILIASTRRLSVCGAQSSLGGALLLTALLSPAYAQNPPDSKRSSDREEGESEHESNDTGEEVEISLPAPKRAPMIVRFPLLGRKKTS